MTYLLPGEHESYGLDAGIPEAWTRAASRLMDAHCRRATLAVAEYRERLRLAPGRSLLRLTYLPLATVAPNPAPIVTLRVRYAPASARKGSAPAGDLADDVLSAFALPGSWTELSVSGLDLDPELGELALPIHALGLAYNEAEVTYTAGFLQLPDEVKFACAQIVRNALATPALNVRSGKVDLLQLDYFSDSLLDSSVRTLLAPYVALRTA